MHGPLAGLLADFVSRRVLAAAGGLGMGLALVTAGLAPSFEVLMAAVACMGFASGFYGHGTEAALMDMHRSDRTGAMARLVTFGAAGNLAGPLLLAGAFWLGLEWRYMLVGGGSVIIAHALLLACQPFPASLRSSDGPARWRSVVATVREPRVLHCTAVIAADNLLDSGFVAFLLLYLVDAVGLTPATASAVLGASVLAKLVGLLFLPAAAGALGVRRLGAALAAGFLAAIVGLVLLPGVVPKLLVLMAFGLIAGGVYSLFKAEAMSARPDNVGTVSGVISAAGLPADLFPLAAGVIADAAGLRWAMLSFALSPALVLALLVLTPAGRSQGRLSLSREAERPAQRAP